MIWCLISVGRIIFWDANAVMSILRSCIRTISRQFSSRTTEELPVPRERNIWILGIFYHRPNQKGGPSYWVLSHRQYGRGFFYQTSSKQEISSVQKIDYESTGLKSTLIKGVCLESSSFILSKLSNIWIPVTLTSCFISNTRMDYLLFKIDYSAFTIWHLFTIAIDISNCFLAKTWELLTIVIEYNSSI